MIELTRVVRPAALSRGWTRSRLRAVSRRRAVLALLILMLIVALECAGVLSLDRDGAALGIWACAACHA